MSALPPIATGKADIRSRSDLLYPRKRTCAVQPGMSALVCGGSSACLCLNAARPLIMELTNEVLDRSPVDCDRRGLEICLEKAAGSVHLDDPTFLRIDLYGNVRVTAATTATFLMHEAPEQHSARPGIHAEAQKHQRRIGEGAPNDDRNRGVFVARHPD